MSRKSVIKLHEIYEFFEGEVKLIKRGENSYESNHVERYSFNGDSHIDGQVHANMKDRIYNVEVVDAQHFFATMSTEEDPYSNILDSLKEIEKNLENDKSLSIDWRFVRCHLGSMKRWQRHRDAFYEVFNFLLRLFSVYQCSDFSIIADIFQLESFIFDFNADYVEKTLKIARMITMMKKNQTCCEKEGLNYVAKLMELPYKCDNLPLDLNYEVIQKHILNIDEEILKYLLEYGVMYAPLNDHISTWDYIRKQIYDLIHPSQKRFVLKLRNIQANFKELSSESRLRMLAVFRAVEVILHAKYKEPNQFALCFRMAYETIPEPIITSKEVGNFFKYVLSASSTEIIEDFRKYYEEVFPESLAPRAPRTLKHLSRCQVRQNLRKTKSLPWGVFEIELPASLKDYVISVKNDPMHEEDHKIEKSSE